MDSSVAALRRALASAGEASTEDAPPGTCTLCGRQLSTPDPGVVEVSVPPESGEVRICPSCYADVVAEPGLAPLRVFKSGPRRQVVLPADVVGEAAGEAGE
jgi:hypothetical protein